MKEQKYKEFIKRLEYHFKQKNYFESSWYSYAVLEDRCKSLLRLSENPSNQENTNVRMLGPKIGELQNRKPNDKYLKGVLFTEKEKPDLLEELSNWKDDRNTLMHAMAEDDALTINAIDLRAEKMASKGVELVRKFCAACRSLKKYKKKED